MFYLQKLRSLGGSSPPLEVRALPSHSAPPARPQSLILGAPFSCKEAEQEEGREEELGCGDGQRTVEGSSATDNGYAELRDSFCAKPEPAVVSLEFGVARMTC